MIEKKLFELLSRFPGIRRLHVTPEFYVGFTRMVWKEIDLAAQQTGSLAHQTLPRIPMYSDQEIVDFRLGDRFYYRGVSVRVAKEFR